MFLIVTVMGQLPSNIWRLPVKPFTTIAVFVFALVALIQALRIVLGWDITVNGISIPPWASVIAVVVAATLAFKVWREMRV
jgi:hypothetical protein